MRLIVAIIIKTLIVYSSQAQTWENDTLQPRLKNQFTLLQNQDVEGWIAKTPLDFFSKLQLGTSQNDKDSIHISLYKSFIDNYYTYQVLEQYLQLQEIVIDDSIAYFIEWNQIQWIDFCILDNKANDELTTSTTGLILLYDPQMARHYELSYIVIEYDQNIQFVHFIQVAIAKNNKFQCIQDIEKVEYENKIETSPTFYMDSFIAQINDKNAQFQLQKIAENDEDYFILYFQYEGYQYASFNLFPSTNNYYLINLDDEQGYILLRLDGIHNKATWYDTSAQLIATFTLQKK